jgi:ribosomal protein S18 acetylase RimI-like enzyme
MRFSKSSKLNKYMNKYSFRLFFEHEKDDLLEMVKTFVKEHERYQEEDVDPDDTELDDDDNWIWGDSKTKMVEHERIFYPLGLFVNDAKITKDSFEKALGFCILCKNNKEWIILEFSINPEFRNKKLGSFLAKNVIDFCINKSLSIDILVDSISIEASSNVKNLRANKFWNSLGFKTIEHNVTFTDRTLYGVGKFNKNVYVHHFKTN